jgi:hypothetical protein
MEISRILQHLNFIKIQCEELEDDFYLNKNRKSVIDDIDLIKKEVKFIENLIK